MTTDREKKLSTVDTTMVADARAVSLPSWEEST
jgi:hypothetical protein